MRKLPDGAARERLLQAIFDAEPECVKLLDRDLRLLMINRAGVRMIEAPSESAAVGHSLLPLVLEHDRPAVKAFVDRVFQGESGIIDFEFQGLKGTRLWMELHASPLRNDRGEVEALLGVTRDVTDRKRALDRCSELERWSESLISALGEVTYDWKPLSNELTWGGAFTQALGYAADEMGKTTESWTGRVHPDDLEAVMAEVDRAAEQHRHYNLEYRFRHREGHYVWVHDRGVLSFNDKGQLFRIIGVILEVTERKEAEEALRRANERYIRQRDALTKLAKARGSQALELSAAFRQVSEVAADTLEVERASVWTFNSSRTRLICVDLFERSSKKHSSGPERKADLLPLYFMSLETDDIVSADNLRKEPRLAELTRDLTGLGVTSLIHAPVRQGGELVGVICFEHIGAPRNWRTDEQGFAISLATMVALGLAQWQHEKVEEQLRQSQKMEAIGQLAGGVAHDFNNILTVMMMQTELIGMTSDLPQSAKHGLREIRVVVERAANLTRQLLLFSRKQVMDPRELNLNEIVTSLAQMLQRIIGADIALKLHLHPKPLIARADPGMIDQALLNLAVNARDAMPKGGALILETREVVVDEEMARIHPDAQPGRYVGISVSDTGAGIPPEIMPRIFEPFFTTKEPGKGTGLGLATVFGIVKQHRGWLKVYSEPGQGANFQLFIPASAQTSAKAKEAATAPQPRGGNETILVAEDEPSVRMLTRAILEQQGYTVLEASSGDEAVEVWKKNRGRVRLLFTDLVMPGVVTGQQLAEKLRADDPKLKIIYSSGYSAEIAGRELELRPGENFLQKPYLRDQLLNTIRSSLDH